MDTIISPSGQAISGTPQVALSPEHNVGQRLVIATINHALDLKNRPQDFFGGGWVPNGTVNDPTFSLTSGGYYYFRVRLADYPVQASTAAKVAFLIGAAVGYPLGTRIENDWGYGPFTVTLDATQTIQQLHSNPAVQQQIPSQIPAIDAAYRAWRNQVDNLMLLGNQVGMNLPATAPYARLAPQAWLAMSDAERLVRAGGVPGVKSAVDGYMRDSTRPRLISSKRMPVIRPTGQVVPVAAAATSINPMYLGIGGFVAGMLAGAGLLWLANRPREREQREQRRWDYLRGFEAGGGDLDKALAKPGWTGRLVTRGGVTRFEQEPGDGYDFEAEMEAAEVAREAGIRKYRRSLGLSETGNDWPEPSFESVVANQRQLMDLKRLEQRTGDLAERARDSEARVRRAIARESADLSRAEQDLQDIDDGSEPHA